METTTVTLAKRGVKCSFSLRLSESQPLSLPSPIQHCCAPGSTEHHPTRSLVLKKECSNSPPLLRCKRNANLSGLNYPFPQQPLASVVRRNERERNRVRQVNAGFQTLRQHVPSGVANNGKLSKVETLRSAVEYIRALQQVLEESDAVSKIFQSGSIPYPSMTVSSSISPGPESPNSTYSSSSEDGCSYGNVSSEECELLDFTSLFHRF